MGNFTDKAALKKAFELQKGYIDTEVGKKQDSFTPGEGLQLENGVLKITIDHTLFKVVQTLPDKPAEGDENKIHLVPSTATGTQDYYTEYIWDGTKWEKLGEFKADVDLTPYQKKEDLIGTVSETGFSISKDKGATKLVEMALQNGDFTGATDDGNKVTFSLKEILSAAIENGFYKIAVDKKGRVTGVTAVSLQDLTTLGVATSEALNLLTARVVTLEGFVANPITEQEVTELFNEVFGTN